PVRTRQLTSPAPPGAHIRTSGGSPGVRAGCAMRSSPLAGTPMSSRAGAVLDARAGRAAAVAGGLVGRLALGWADGMALLAVALWGLNFSITKGVVAQVPPLSGSLLRGILT